MFSNIYELYNNTLLAEQPLVQSIVANIKFKIEQTISEGVANRFLYDANVFLSNSNKFTKERVLDQVIRYFRSRGIRIRKPGYLFEGTTTPVTKVEQVNGEFDSAFSDDFMVYEEVIYGATTDGSATLLVEWHIRSQQEYMKHYC